MELCRYVVLNPVRAKLEEKPGEWKWSSYLSTAGRKEVPEYLTTDWMLGLFSKDKTEAQKLYRRFVKSGIGDVSPWKDLQGQILLGEEWFIDRYKDFFRSREQIKEIPRSQRLLNRPRLTELFSDGDESAGRNKLIYSAHVQYGYKLREISGHLGIHYTTVSKAIKRVNEVEEK